MPSSFAVDGLVSGLQTKSIISQLMAIERRPLDLLKQSQNRDTLKSQSIESIKKAVSGLQTALTSLLDRNRLNAKSATTDTPSGSATVVGATATSAAVNGSFKVTVSQLATTTKLMSTGPMGSVINKTAALASAGFRLSPVVQTSGGGPTTFSINGHSISVDNTTTLNDGTANSIIAKINAAGAGVTASLVADADGRADNRVQLVSAPGQSIQLGSFGDTSNILRLLNLDGATIQGNTASTVTSGAVSAGALNTSVTVNGVTTAINQANGGFTDVQNAAFIVNAINSNSSNTVTAVDNGDGTFRLNQKTVGSQQTVAITTAGMGTGLSAGTTQNGTDRVVSQVSLGVTDTGRQLADSRLATAVAGYDGSGNAKFKVNGVEITYRATDSVATIINRINEANTGAIATYDPVRDRLQITSTQTGSRSVSLEDVQGNFLAATGVLAATQTLGQNAAFTIDTVNGGQTLTSSSNTVPDLVPGVTLELKSVSASPVTVTVAQDTATTVSAFKGFVDKVNAVLTAIEDQTKFDPKTKQQSALTGDAGIRDLQRQLRSLISGASIGSTGKYQNLSDLGVSSGSVGAAVGTTNRLSLDEAKLTAALKDNPQAVQALVSGFQASMGAVSGTGSVTQATGTPTSGVYENGTYKIRIINNLTGEAEVSFVANDGRTLLKKLQTVTANSDNTTLIPGMTVHFGTLAIGEDAFTMTVTQRGVGLPLSGYLTNTLGDNGLFKSRADGATKQQELTTKRIAEMETRLQAKEDALNRKFTGLETAMARLQSQSSGFLSQLSKLSGSSG